MPLTTILPCVVCKTGKPRFQVKNLANGRTANICSVKCLLSWCLGFSVGSAQNIVKLILKGISK